MQSSSCLCNSSCASIAWENATLRKLWQPEHGATPWQQSNRWFWVAWCRGNWVWKGFWRPPKQTPPSNPGIVGKLGFPEYKCAWTAMLKINEWRTWGNKYTPKGTSVPSHISWSSINKKLEEKRNGVGLKLEGSCCCYIRKDAWPFLSLNSLSLFLLA